VIAGDIDYYGTIEANESVTFRVTFTNLDGSKKDEHLLRLIIVTGPPTRP
jgi:hypothetical protein